MMADLLKTVASAKYIAIHVAVEFVGYSDPKQIDVIHLATAFERLRIIAPTKISRISLLQTL